LRRFRGAAAKGRLAALAEIGVVISAIRPSILPQCMEVFSVVFCRPHSEEEHDEAPRVYTRRQLQSSRRSAQIAWLD